MNEKKFLTLNEYTKLLMDFLKKNNAKTLFLMNCRKDITRHIGGNKIVYTFFNPMARERLKNTLKYNRGTNILSTSFVWLSTNEGHEFWKKLHEKWKNLIIENNIYYNEKSN